MSFLPKDELEPGNPKKNGKDGKQGPSTTRIVMWVVTLGIALYFIGTGLYGILTN